MIELCLPSAVAFFGHTVCCAVAYRLHRGHKGLDIEFAELLRQSAIFALFITPAGLTVLFLIGFGSRGHDLPGLLLLPVGALVLIGAQVINWVFGLDSWPAGLDIYLLHGVALAVLLVPAVAIFGPALLHLSGG